MTQQFPPKPWNVDDTFVNIETGVEYVFKGEQWIAGGTTQYEPGYKALGKWQYKRSGDADAGGIFRNKAASGSQPHDALTEVRVNNTPKDGSGPVIDPNSWEAGQLLRIEKGGDKVIYRITAATAATNYGDLTLEFIELQGSPFTFYVDDRINLELRELFDDPIDRYLPLTGGTLTGNLTVQGQTKVDGGNEFKLQYDDDTTMFRIQPNANQITSKASILNLKSTPGDALNGRAGLDVQVNGENPLAISNSGSYQETLAIYGYDGEAPGGRAKNLWITASGNINLEGNVNAQSFLKGSELRSTKLTSGQSSNLQIYRGSGASEQRKMLVGTDSVNFDVSIKLVGATVDGKVNKDIQVLNGTKLFVSDEGGEIITFGGSGAFYRGAISQPDHLVNREYVDAAVADNADEDNTKSRLSLGTYTLRTTSGQPSGNATAGELTLWHLDPSEAATNPAQEFKVGGGYGHQNIFALVQDLIETSLGADKPPVWYFVQGDKEQRMVSNGQGWTTTGTYHSSGTEYSGDVLTGGQEVELFLEADLNYVWQKQDDYYEKTGGNINGFVRVVKPDGVAFGTRTTESADNNFQVWADGIVDFKNRIQFTGSTKSIYSGSTEMFDFSGTNVRIPRRGDNSIGFQLKGKSDADDNLFNVYHRPDQDEIMYRGKINDPYAIVNKQWVEQNASGGFVPGNRVAKDGNSSISVGGMYLQNGNLYVKVS